MTVQSAAIENDRLNDWEASHAQREAGRRSPTGFFAVTGLYWLSSEPVLVPGVPGRWSAKNGRVAVDLSPGEAVERDGQTLTDTQWFAEIGERGSLQLTVPEGQSPEHGVTSLEIAQRGGQFILRPKSAAHPFLTEYEGTERFDYDAQWRITGHYEPFSVAKPVTVGAAVEGIEHVYSAPGKVRFTAQGAEHTLLALDGPSVGELLLLFTDETSGFTTYHALRALRIPRPISGDDRVVLDFNHASNLPCAYTDLATCPLPPAGNKVAARITAGEKKPRQRVQASLESPGLTWELVVRT